MAQDSQAIKRLSLNNMQQGQQPGPMQAWQGRGGGGRGGGSRQLETKGPQSAQSNQNGKPPLMPGAAMPEPPPESESSRTEQIVGELHAMVNEWLSRLSRSLPERGPGQKKAAHAHLCDLPTLYAYPICLPARTPLR